MEVEIIKRRLISLLFCEDVTTTCEIYLFGSVLHRNNYKDIDILIVYETNDNLKLLKHLIEGKLPHAILHFTCLTFQEQQELNFIREYQAYRVLKNDAVSEST